MTSMKTAAASIAAAKLIEKARLQVVLRERYFATILMYMKVFEDGSATRTMSTDGKNIAFCPQFVATLREDETMVIILHELLHVNFLHHLREGSRDHDVWNMACDYVINLTLKRCGYQIPEGGLLNDSFEGKTAEEVYEIIAKEISQRPKLQRDLVPGNAGGSEKSQGKGASGDQGGQEGESDSASGQEEGDEDKDSAGKGSGGEKDAGEPKRTALSDRLTQEEIEQAMRGEVRQLKSETGEDLSEAEINAAENDIKKIIAIAERVSRGCGKGGGSLHRDLKENALITQANWGRLADYVSKLSRDESSWSYPNRRHVHTGCYLPSMRGFRSLGDVLLVDDSSGSITNDMWASYMASFRSLFEQYKIDKVTVLVCDATIQAEYIDILPEEIEDVKNVGGGGTDFRPPFRWVEEHAEQVDLLIYLTDLRCNSFPYYPPPYPVVWACWGSYSEKQKPPFGEVIKV